MLPPPFENALVLTGPTASGKTQLGIDIARRLDAEIVSMDSMAVYRRMDIGTAKPTPEQREATPHHLVDVLDPWESASVWWWLDQAKRCVRDIEARGKKALFVGGTPLYLKALMAGLFEGPSANESIRKRLTEEAQALGSVTLHRRLSEVDPVSAERLHPNDVRRMVRALEVFELTGKPLSAWQTQWDRRPHAPREEPVTRSVKSTIWLDLPRAELYDRINHRVEAMFAAGLLDEAKHLRSLEGLLSLEARQAVGYKEAFAVLDRTITLKEAIVLVQTRSRQFAKRQMAWFRHLPECRPVTIEMARTLWQRELKS